jgi:hypothetical protein
MINRTEIVLKLLVFIIDWNNTQKLKKVLEKEFVRFHYIFKGRGTASSEILDMLGIGSSEKAVAICLEPDFRVPVLLKEVSKSMGLHNPSSGIAFAIPISGINNYIVQMFNDETNERIKKNLENAAEKMENEAKYDLIITALNQGYSEELMSVARKAGATGGTVVNARSVAHEGAVKFFGISIQEEKEIVAILSSRKNKIEIMKAISQSFGILTEAKGLVFSLPADNVTGIDLS